MAYTKYSLTPANNNAAPPDGAPEGMLPSAVNDTMRDMMAQIRDVGDGIRGGTYTMTAPVITGGSITGVALSGNTFTNPVITGGSINNTPIGASTANTGAFTTLSASGVATFSAGTVSAPAITTTGDTNTGIFFPAADTIAFTEGGVESMRIDSSGNVGIGMTPSGDSRLEVYSADSATIYKNVNTGTGSSDGFYVGMGKSSATEAYVYNRENNNIIFGTNNTERMRIDSSGNLLVGTTTALGATSHTFFGSATTVFANRNTNTASGNYFEFGHDSNNNFRVTNQNAAGVYLTNGGTSWTALSDENSKTDLHPITNAAEKVSTLRAVTGRYKTDHENISRVFLIAQDVQKVLPEAVSKNPNGYLGLAYTETIPLLVAAIKEQQAMIETLQAEVALLKSK